MELTKEMIRDFIAGQIAGGLASRATVYPQTPNDKDYIVRTSYDIADRMMERSRVK